LGVVAGALIGSVGFFAEYAWSHVWMVNAWPASLIGEGLPLALITGIGAGVLGGAIGRAVTPQAASERVPRWALPAAGIAVLAVIVWCVPQPVPSNPPKATVALTPANSGPHRTAYVTARLQPADAAKNARWLNVTAWQGGGKIVNKLKQVGPGTYRSTQALPLYGDWKSTLRLQTGREVLGVPIYMPPDTAIPVKGIPAPPQFTRQFTQDKKLLQREQKKGVSTFLWTLAYLAVLLIALVVGVLLVLGLRRIRQSLGDGQAPPPGSRREGETRPQTRVATA
jgi:hypothetical protein